MWNYRYYFCTVEFVTSDMTLWPFSVFHMDLMYQQDKTPTNLKIYLSI